MLRRLTRAVLAVPGHIWVWSQHDPYQAIGVGTLVMFLALAAKLLLAIVAGVAILGGLYRLSIPDLG